MMSNNFGYIDIILLAMIAGFIILRLRNILGRKTGHQDKTFSTFDKKMQKDFEFIKEKVSPEKIKETGLEGSQKEEFLTLFKSFEPLSDFLCSPCPGCYRNFFSN